MMMMMMMMIVVVMMMMMMVPWKYMTTKKMNTVDKRLVRLGRFCLEKANDDDDDHGDDDDGDDDDDDINVPSLRARSLF
jgi:hypothetical protein